MNIKNTYPVFEPDQVLTNQHLNDLFNYLDQQSRLTRIKLIGKGIVCGLEISSGQESIKISKGCGITSQGFLITFCDTVYSYLIPYTTRAIPDNLDFIKQCGDLIIDKVPFYKPAFNDNISRLITKDEYNNLDTDAKGTAFPISQITDSLNDYAVVLFLEAEEIDLKNCDTNNCNDKGSMIDFDVKALIIKKSIIDVILREGNLLGSGISLNSFSPQRITLKRYNVPINNLKTAGDVLEAFVRLVDDSTLNNLAESFKKGFENYFYLLEGENLNPFTTLFQDLKKLRDKILKQYPILIQYFYDLVDDLVKAYNEFIFKAFNISAECCGDEMRFPLHLLLGEASINTSIQGHSAYRQYFIYSPLFASQQERLNEIHLLFERIKLLLLNFSIDSMLNFEKRIVKVTPSHYGDSFLSGRAIPYYYKVNENGKELYINWDFKKTFRGEAESSLSYNSSQYSNDDRVINPLNYDIEPYNFFRVEGHIGKPVFDALTALKGINHDYNLPFEVTALSADYIGVLLRGEEPQCIIQDLESDYRILIAEFVCKLHDAFCTVSRVRYTSIRTFLTFNITGMEEVSGISSAEAASADNSADNNEDSILKTGTELKLTSIPHPFISNLVSEFHSTKSYRKGDTISRLCQPAKGTVGEAYLSIISGNNGKFKNPSFFTASSLLSPLYYNLFEFLDSVESMFEILMSNELAELNIAPFKAAYDRFETAVKNVFSQLAKLTGSSGILLYTCIVEQLEALKSEYLRRTAEYRLAKNFSYYFNQHGGVEHKGGVPKSGTFILVYHEERRRRFIDAGSLFVNRDLSSLLLSHFTGLLQPDLKPDDLEFQTKQLQMTVLYKDPELYVKFKDVMKRYLDDCKDLPDEKRKIIVDTINQPPPAASFDIQDGTVIADFYIPYICCSDCPPIAYILPQPKETEKPVITIKSKDFCSNQPGNGYIIVSPSGGIITGIAVQQADVNTFRFNTENLLPGEITVTYTISGESVSDIITIHAAPSASFTKEPLKDKPNIIEFTSDDKDSATKHLWEFGDDQSGAANRSEEANPKHEYVFSELSKVFVVTHRTSNDINCFDEDKQEISVSNKQEEISDELTLCYAPRILLEPNAAEIKILNMEELKPLFEKYQVSIVPQMILVFNSELEETITFTIKYSINDGTTTVIKNRKITIIGVNTRFNMKYVKSSKRFTLSSYAKDPEALRWLITINGAGDNSITGEKPKIQISFDQIANLELMNIQLEVTEAEENQKCTRVKKVQLKLEEIRTIMDLTGGKDF